MAQGDRSLDFSIWLGAEMYSGLVTFIVYKDSLLFSPFFLINFIFPFQISFFPHICVCARAHGCTCITACM